MPLERRVARRRDFEITKFSAQVRPAEKRLPRDIAKRRCPIFLVAEKVDRIPAIVAGQGRECEYGGFGHGRTPSVLAAATNSRARGRSSSRASRRSPPISNIVSSP